MIDLSRHFQPLASIRSIIDSLSYAKLNVLHMHMSDEQSFPMVQKDGLFAVPFYTRTNTRIFAKTGSGQRTGKVEKEGLVSAGGQDVPKALGRGVLRPRAVHAGRSREYD